MASLKVSYILWLLFGWLGLHHVYLGRNNQAIIWFMTWGGGLGLGWLRDMWRIPDYVAWSNRAKNYQKLQLNRITLGLPAQCSTFRFAGMFVMGFFMSIVLSGLVPEYTEEHSTSRPIWYIICEVLSIALLLVGSALGVYLVANVGELQCSLFYPAFGSIVGLAWVLGNSVNVSMPTIISAILTWWKGLRWRPMSSKDLRKSGPYCISLYLLASTAWISLLGYGFFFSAVITINNGEKIPASEAFSNFFKSPAWHQTRDSFSHLYRIYSYSGWSRAYSDAQHVFDLSGEQRALTTLGLDSYASADTIRKQCRELSREFHPDHQRTAEGKSSAQSQFIKIQDACNTLKKLRPKSPRTFE